MCVYMYLFVSRGGRAWALQIKIPQILHLSKLIKKISKCLFFITPGKLIMSSESVYPEEF